MPYFPLHRRVPRRCFPPIIATFSPGPILWHAGCVSDPACGQCVFRMVLLPARGPVAVMAEA